MHVEKTLRSLVEYAYEMGFHEVGYDVVAEFKKELLQEALRIVTESDPARWSKLAVAVKLRELLARVINDESSGLSKTMR